MSSNPFHFPFLRLPNQNQQRPTVILRSGDGQAFVIVQQAAFQSKLLRELLCHCGLDGQDVTEPIDLQQVSGVVLKKILQWCYDNRMETFREKQKEEDPRVQLTRYDELYMDVESEFLVDLLLGADYLDIPGLVEILTQKIANMGNGKNVEELRHIYRLENDLTEEQQKHIKKSFAWIEGDSKSDEEEKPST